MASAKEHAATRNALQDRLKDGGDREDLDRLERHVEGAITSLIEDRDAYEGRRMIATYAAVFVDLCGLRGAVQRAKADLAA